MGSNRPYHGGIQKKLDDRRLAVHGIGRSGTTWVARTINSHPDIWITNEFILYDMPFGTHVQGRSDPEDASQYFNRLTYKTAWNQTEEHFWDIPPTFKEDFVSKCMEKLNGRDASDKANWIRCVEEVLYKDYKFFGDKVLEVSALKQMLHSGLPYRLVYVLRDGRGNYCSRRRSQFGGDYIATWTRGLREWFEFRDELGESKYFVVRFEDLMYRPKITIAALCEWIGVEAKPIMQGFFRDRRKNHFESWKFEIPQWQKLFVGESFEMLKRTGYV